VAVGVFACGLLIGWLLHSLRRARSGLSVSMRARAREMFPPNSLTPVEARATDVTNRSGRSLIWLSQTN
jgi:hypothetical protein